MPRFIPNSAPYPERPRCAVSGKLMFPDEREARAEAERIHRKDGTELDVYLCMACDHWHFTSSAR
ncbi:MAG TPA: hypothetical protein VL500_05420 [Candidatus Eisenbacteria bacterium]|nr:hypothetical protein [Candidatus Eisenbacteria bacterium]